MDQKTMSKLRFDTRLQRRRGWVSDEALEQEIAKLPDVSGKIAEDEPSEAESAASPESASAAPPAHGGDETPPG